MKYFVLIFFLGIPTSKCNLCGDRRSPLGGCPPSFPCIAYFNTHGSQAAKDVRSGEDKLIDVFNRIEHFFCRLEIYVGITPTTAMTAIVIDIMAEVLTILGIATKEVKRGGFSE